MYCISADYREIVSRTFHNNRDNKVKFHNNRDNKGFAYKVPRDKSEKINFPSTRNISRREIKSQTLKILTVPSHFRWPDETRNFNIPKSSFSLEPRRWTERYRETNERPARKAYLERLLVTPMKLLSLNNCKS